MVTLGLINSFLLAGNFQKHLALMSVLYFHNVDLVRI